MHIKEINNVTKRCIDYDPSVTAIHSCFANMRFVAPVGPVHVALAGI